MRKVKLVKLARNTTKGFDFNSIEGYAYLGLPEEGKAFRMTYTPTNATEDHSMHTSVVQKVFPQDGDKITFETLNSVYELTMDVAD